MPQSARVTKNNSLTDDSQVSERSSRKKRPVTAKSQPPLSIAHGRLGDEDPSLRIHLRAVSAVKNFLGSEASAAMWSRISGLFVPANTYFEQKKVSDRIIGIRNESGNIQTSIEVSGDRNDHTGNLFIETSALGSKGKRGTLTATQAEWNFYYLVNSGHLFCVRTADLLPWFNSKQSNFKDREFSVSEGSSSTTKRGKLVPISLLMSDIPGMWHFVYRGAWRRLESSYRLSD